MPSAEEDKCFASQNLQDKYTIVDQKPSSPFKTVYSVDDFKPIKVLGHGNMGTVFLAVLRSTNEPFAMKVMHKQVLKARKNTIRMEREREILAMLKHPFLPSLVAHLESDQHVFFVTEFCSGGDLNKIRRQQVEKSFSETAIRFFGAEVLCALEHLHRLGIIYRDLKPENILVGEDGHITLTDFDLSLICPSTKKEKRSPAVKSAISNLPARRPDHVQMRCRPALFVCNRIAEMEPSSCVAKVSPQESSSKAKIKPHPSDVRSHSFVGTEEYVAPELVWGTGHGRAVDWWTFGVLLYELLYDHTPFRGLNKKDTFSNIISKEPEMPGPPSPLKDLISKLLIKDPNRRLGASYGAREVKRHDFFQGVRWDHLKDITRPPVVPSPFSLEELQNIDRKEIVIDEHLIEHELSSSIDTMVSDKGNHNKSGNSDSSRSRSSQESSSSSSSQKSSFSIKTNWTKRMDAADRRAEASLKCNLQLEQACTVGQKLQQKVRGRPDKFQADLCTRPAASDSVTCTDRSIDWRDFNQAAVFLSDF